MCQLVHTNLPTALLFQIERTNCYGSMFLFNGTKQDKVQKFFRGAFFHVTNSYAAQEQEKK